MTVYFSDLNYSKLFIKFIVKETFFNCLNYNYFELKQFPSFSRSNNY